MENRMTAGVGGERMEGWNRKEKGFTDNSVMTAGGRGI